MAFTQTWNFHDLSLHLVSGDIFEVPTQAIVNSEQTDFILGLKERSISGQIRIRHPSVQDELNALTLGKIQPRGTVLLTSRGPQEPGRHIYHAGFHAPWEWLDDERDDGQTEYVTAIRHCVRDIFSRMRSDGIESVAFPLLGTGVFDLDPALLAREFIHDLLLAANQDLLPRGAAIWLVVRDEPFIQVALCAMVQALLDVNFPAPADRLDLGVPYLDRFEASQVSSNHPSWQAWMLCRYTEFVMGFIFYHLASGRIHPAQLLAEQNEALNSTRAVLPLSFGQIRNTTEKIVKDVGADAFTEPWPRFFAGLVEEDRRGNKRLSRINEDRNRIAHGGAFRAAGEIRQDLREFLRIGEWQALASEAGPPDPADVCPWVASTPWASASADPTAVGVLETIAPRHLQYIVPETGEVFRVPIPESP